MEYNYEVYFVESVIVDIMLYFIFYYICFVGIIGLFYFIYLSYVGRKSNDNFWVGVDKIYSKGKIFSSEHITIINAILEQIGQKSIFLGFVASDFYVICCFLAMVYISQVFFIYFFIVSIIVFIIGLLGLGIECYVFGNKKYERYVGLFWFLDGVSIYFVILLMLLSFL